MRCVLRVPRVQLSNVFRPICALWVVCVQQCNVALSSLD